MGQERHRPTALPGAVYVRPEQMMPSQGLSGRSVLPPGADVSFEPSTQRRSIGTHLRRQPIDAPQR